MRATLDVVVGSDGRRGLHYILLARALILGGSHARAAAADQVPTATGKLRTTVFLLRSLAMIVDMLEIVRSEARRPI